MTDGFEDMPLYGGREVLPRESVAAVATRTNAAPERSRHRARSAVNRELENHAVVGRSA
jgi:hypothetical protein